MRIDLNADLGEGFGLWRLGDDEALLELVTSANVACGFHAGDPVTMRRVCGLAVERGVAIGAQVGYHDLAGFGRRFIDIAPEDLCGDVLYQLGALDAIAQAAGGRVRYVKAHGALYHAASEDAGQAGAVTAAVAAFDRGLPILGLAGSRLAEAAAAAGLAFVAEAFADRGYRTDPGAGEPRLVPRGEPGALLDSVEAVVAQALSIVVEERVSARDGAVLGLRAESLCLHGDTPGAVQLARAVRSALLGAGVRLAAFTG